jgi:hypothetical protein
VWCVGDENLIHTRDQLVNEFPGPWWSRRRVPGAKHRKNNIFSTVEKNMADACSMGSRSGAWVTKSE